MIPRNGRSRRTRIFQGAENTKIEKKSKEQKRTLKFGTLQTKMKHESKKIDRAHLKSHDVTPILHLMAMLRALEGAVFCSTLSLQLLGF